MQKRQRIAACVIVLSGLMFLLTGCFGANTPLGKAVSRNDLKDVQELLAQGADPCDKAGRGDYSSLDLAIGDMREMLKSDELNLPLYTVMLEKAYQGTLAGKKCPNILFYAARIGDIVKVRQLLAIGADPNQGKENWETSPLGIAAYYGHDEAVAALVEGGADVEQQLFNFERLRLWAASIGKQASYMKADRAMKLLNRVLARQQQPKQQQ